MRSDMIKAAAIANMTDTGVASLCLLARNFGLSTDPTEVIGREISNGGAVTKEDLLSLAKKLGLEARLITTKWNRLHEVALPAIACLDDGSFLIATRFCEGKIAVEHPVRGRPYFLEAAEFNYLWNRQLILLKPSQGKSFAIKGLFAATQRFLGRERRSTA